jgi:hypothetical protein
VSRVESWSKQVRLIVKNGVPLRGSITFSSSICSSAATNVRIALYLLNSAMRYNHPCNYRKSEIRRKS